MTLTPETVVDTLVARARRAQGVAAIYSQTQIDQLCLAVGWAIMAPARNRALAELAVRDTGLGNVLDKIQKNHRKTLGLLRDIAHAKTVGQIGHNPETGITEIARPIGVIGAITPSTNPGATPANKIINAVKGGNAIILAPSPKGASTCAQLLAFIYEEFDKIGAPHDLVQMLPIPVNKALTHALMARVDLIVATGSQANIKAAYSSGTPALGVGAGNVSVIVDTDADLAQAAQHIARSKTFDNATSCSSENAVIILDSLYEAMLAALLEAGGALLDATEKIQLQQALWPHGKLSPALTAQSAQTIATLVGLSVAPTAQFLMVEESAIGADAPYSGEKLSPVLAVYRARDFSHACELVASIYAFQGAGHSVGYHGGNETHIAQLAHTLPVARVIVNQAHCIATGGSFSNGLPFSLSMGCGSWGGNSFSDNLHWKHFINITRIARPIAEHIPSEASIFGAYWKATGQ
jgi:sulfoacetaldehyde dehydrogenase